MKLIDVNVLVAMFLADHVHHDSAADWWQDALEAGEPVTVPDMVWVGFVRLVTNSRVVTTPATFEQAWAFTEAVAAQPTYLTFSSDPAVLAGFAQLGGEASARGDLVTDAYIAACAKAYAATVVTFDRDFRKFDGLRVMELPG